MDLLCGGVNRSVKDIVNTIISPYEFDNLTLQRKFEELKSLYCITLEMYNESGKGDPDDFENVNNRRYILYANCIIGTYDCL